EMVGEPGVVVVQTSLDFREPVAIVVAGHDHSLTSLGEMLSGALRTPREAEPRLGPQPCPATRSSSLSSPVHPVWWLGSSERGRSWWVRSTTVSLPSGVSTISTVVE